MSVPAAYAQHAGSQLLQVQQLVADMQVKVDVPPVVYSCIAWSWHCKNITVSEVLKAH